MPDALYKEVVLTLRPIRDPNGVPPITRLRKLLKGMRRAYGWTVTDMKGVPLDEPAATALADEGPAAAEAEELG